MKPLYRVLVVDDELDIKTIVCEVLTSDGHTCETATNGAEALEKVSRWHPDAVITDIVMPVMDGIALTRELIVRYPALPVMIMTGFTAEYREEEVLHLGASDFIKKPFNINELLIRFLKMMRDVETFHKLKARLENEIKTIEKYAFYDALTGIPNRRFFLERLDFVLKDAKRYNLMFAILFIDLDDFKSINDSLGHDVGDLMLKEVARRLQECVREVDMIARYGGDEFTIILTRIDHWIDARTVAQRVVESIASPMTLAKCECSITTSVGISLYPNDGEDGYTLIKMADSAMYSAKKNGVDYTFHTIPS
jgi:diguanylate cyclase (GGDEF)-like protein